MQGRLGTYDKVSCDLLLLPFYLPLACSLLPSVSAPSWQDGLCCATPELALGPRYALGVLTSA